MWHIHHLVVPGTPVKHALNRANWHSDGSSQGNTQQHAGNPNMHRAGSRAPIANNRDRKCHCKQSRAAAGGGRLEAEWAHVLSAPPKWTPWLICDHVPGAAHPRAITATDAGASALGALKCLLHIWSSWPPKGGEGIHGHAHTSTRHRCPLSNNASAQSLLQLYVLTCW
jgi:hypothetical protein